MKKTIIITLILILSGLTVAGISPINNNEIETNILFSEPIIIETDEHIEISLKEATSYHHISGEYMIPVVTKVYVLPFKTIIQDVNVEFSDKLKQLPEKKIKLAPEPSLDNHPVQKVTSYKKTSNQISYPMGIYPKERYSYHLGAGRQGDTLVNYLTVKIYPIQYDSIQDIIYIAQKVKIQFNYDIPKKILNLPDEYALIIITPDEFISNLEPLVAHKNDKNIQTKIITLTEIYNSDYFPVQGRDCAEEMKYFIKNALDEWGIKYVLLIGGRNSGITEPEWWMPVRYLDLDDGNEATYISDLYYGDIYDSEGNFSSWDSNGNDLFSEWSTDIPDVYPEVFVGRLACKTKFEVKTMVNKIINYENTAYGSDWFKRFVGVAGDTYPNPNDPYYEGELATQESANYLENFDATFLWTSTGSFTDMQDVIDEISKGCGFLHFSGHGNPYAWGNHPPNDDEIFINGPNAFEMKEFSNNDMQPITIVGGCHNAQFDVGLGNMIRDILEYGIKQYFFEKPFLFFHMEWIPTCWSWSLVNKDSGGGIAIIANTGLGYGIPGQNWHTGRGRFMELNFFRSYSEGYDILGETHAQDLIYYLNEFPPGTTLLDLKIPQQWVLLGDPSLKIGGYQ